MPETYDSKTKVSTIKITASSDPLNIAADFVNSLVNFNIVDIIQVNGKIFGIKKVAWTVESAKKWLLEQKIVRNEELAQKLAEKAINERCDNKYCKME